LKDRIKALTQASIDARARRAEAVAGTAASAAQVPIGDAGAAMPVGGAEPVEAALPGVVGRIEDATLERLAKRAASDIKDEMERAWEGYQKRQKGTWLQPNDSDKILAAFDTLRAHADSVWRKHKNNQAMLYMKTKHAVAKSLQFHHVTVQRCSTSARPK
jgi:hypothetical protein